MSSTNVISKLRKQKMQFLISASILLLALTACGGTSDAGTDDNTYTFTVASGAMDGTPHYAIEQHYLDRLEDESDGQITFDRSSFEALCTMDEIVNCLSDGRADIGTTVTDYTPHMLPSLSVISIPFLNTDMQASVAALYETHTEYGPAKELMADNNLELVSTWPAGSMLIGSTEPITSVADLEGLRARAAGPVIQHTLETTGVNVNAITAAETYESLQRGVLDSVAVTLDFAVNYQITEQLPYWAEPGIGQYTAYGMWWSKDTYDSLPDELQEIVDLVTAELNGGEAVEVYNNQMRAVCDGMLESPHVEQFTSWDSDAKQDLRRHVGNEAEDLWLSIVDDYGFDAADEYLETYKASYSEHVSDDNPVDAGLGCVDEWQELHG